jgi:hypothetical protein
MAALGTAAALLSAVLLIAPPDSSAKKADRDNVAPSKGGEKFYKATLCATSKKPFWGGPKTLTTSGCEFGATTVSGKVKYNGREAKGVSKTCSRKSQGVNNKVEWCGFADNEKGSISIGADGEMDLGSIQGINAGKMTYWIRIDVFGDGRANLRGGWME